MLFSTRQLIFIALMGSLMFVVNFSVGSWIIAVTGIPASSAFVTGVTGLFWVVYY